MSEPKYRVFMWGEMKPYCYDGPDCDQIRPQWSTYCDGDKEGESGLEELEMKAAQFPAGTKITIEIPMCPNPDCELDSDFAYYQDNICDCGFDWNEWTLNRYN